MFRQLLITSLLVGVSYGSPLPQEQPEDSLIQTEGSGENQTGEYWWQSIPGMDYLGEYHRYIPKSVKLFLGDAYEEGKRVYSDLYDDVEEEIAQKADENINAFTNFATGVIEKFVKIAQKSEQVLIGGSPLSEEELTERAVEIEATKERLRGLAEQVKEEIRSEAEGEEGLAKAVQSFISTIRSMVANEALRGNEWLWSRLRHMEGTSYEALQLVADESEELKYLINDLFATLDEIDLKKIGRVEDEEIYDEEVIDEIDSDGIVDVPRRGFIN